MDTLNSTGTLYVITAMIGAYWLYRIYTLYKRKGKSFDEDYDKLLKAEEYKVKGKFES